MVYNLNIEGQLPAEFVEKRPKAEGNSGQATVIDTQGSKAASSALSRVREAAKRDSKLQFSNLLNHVTVDLLRQSYLALNRQAATGIDNVTWQEYGKELEKCLPDLHDRVQSERYQAKPSKRIWIPKSDGQQRPIGITALEDKIVQQAVATILWVKGVRLWFVEFVKYSTNQSLTLPPLPPGDPTPRHISEDLTPLVPTELPDDTL